MITLTTRPNPNPDSLQPLTVAEVVALLSKEGFQVEMGLSQARFLTRKLGFFIYPTSKIKAVTTRIHVYGVFKGVSDSETSVTTTEVKFFAG